MEKEETEIYEKEQSVLKLKKETEDYRNKIKDGPLWKKVLKKTGQEIGKEIKRWNEASKPKPQKKPKTRS